MHSVAHWLETWNEASPDRTALVDGVSGTRWTYGHLRERACRRAAWLRARGVEFGDRVAWTGKNRLEFFDVLFACARLGAILVPVNWRLAEPEVAWILQDADPVVTLSASDLPDLPEAKGKPDPEPGDASTPLLILYTSGTTGRPKGALLTHGSITWNSINTQIACGLTSRDSTITYTPLFHTGGVNVLSMPLLHQGGRIVLLPEYDGASVLEWIEKEQLTTFFGVPTIFEMLLEEPDFGGTDLSSVRFALCGGAPCPVPLIEAYARRGVVFRQGYGLTEVGPNCFSLPPEDAVRKAGTVGFPVMHCQARIVDEEGHPVETGEVGELLLKGPHVCAGYFRNPEATEEARRNGWWATGDLFSVDDEGYYRVVGRKKEMFISGGENVYPAEVEQALRTLPGLESCAVVGVPDSRWGEVGRAWYVPRSLDPNALRAHLEGRIARYKIPKEFRPVDALPLTASGKVDRRALTAGV